MPNTMILLGFIAIIGSVSLYVSWRNAGEPPSSPGVVIASSAEELNDGWTVHIRYQYEVDDERRESDEVPWVEKLSRLSKDEASNLVKRYAVGTKLTVHGDPARPQRSSSEDSQIRALILLSFFAGLMLMVIGFAMLRAARNNRENRL